LKRCTLLVLLFGSGVTPDVLSATESQMTPMPVAHLVQACRESDGNAFARGYCDGAIDALYRSTAGWCAPPYVTHGEIREYLRREILSHDVSEAPAATFVQQAIRSKWPCKDGQRESQGK